MNDAETLPTQQVVCAIIEHDGKIFAAQRGYGDMKDGWEFPGGKIEEGETPEQALRREIEEELGARLSTMNYLDTVDYDYPSFHLHMDCFVCQLAPGEHIKLLEHEGARWLEQGQLLDVDWLPADHDLIMKLGAMWDAIFAPDHL